MCSLSGDVIYSICFHVSPSSGGGGHPAEGGRGVWKQKKRTHHIPFHDGLSNGSSSGGMQVYLRVQWVVRGLVTRLEAALEEKYETPI